MYPFIDGKTLVIPEDDLLTARFFYPGPSAEQHGLLVTDAGSFPGKVLLYVPESRWFEPKHRESADINALGTLQQLAARYPRQTFCTVGWVPWDRQWPRTAAYLYARGVKIYVPPFMEESWQRMVHQGRNPASPGK